MLCGDMNTYGRVYVSNSGIGLVYGDIDQLSDIKEVVFEKSNSLAKVSSNPFRISTTIQCNNLLRYNIYSINGAMLENGNAQGSVEIGTDFKSGIYILKLIDESNRAMQVIKLVKM